MTFESIPRKRIAVFTRQLATLLGAGLPVARALHTIARQERRGPIHRAASGIARDIEEGDTLSTAFARRRTVFDGLYVSLVRAGESAGILTEVLGRLAAYLEKAARLEARVRTAMLYPVVVGSVALAIVGALVAFVVPRFEEIFATMLKGAPLPALTRAVLETCRFCRSHLLLFVLAIPVLWLVRSALRRSRRWVRFADRCALRLPIVGVMTEKIAVARFARTLGSLLGGGVPILDALSIAGATLGNSILLDAILRVRERVEAGDSLSAPLESTAVFPPLMVGMVAVGEETGSLPEMLFSVADAYDEEVDLAVTALTSVLEPILVIIMALIIGTIVIALFLPVVRIIQVLS